MWKQPKCSLRDEWISKLWYVYSGLTVAVHGLLIAVASLVVEHGLSGLQASAVAAHGLSSCGSQALEHPLGNYGAQA